MTTFAFISDIHGNDHALKAVLSDIDSKKIKNIICLGDVSSYNVGQNKCIEILIERNILWLAGNHDLIAAELLEPDYFNQNAYYSSMKARRILTTKNKSYIKTLALIYSNKYFHAFHASPFKVDEYLTTNERVLNASNYLLEINNLTLAFFGHTHKAITYQIAEDKKITTTSNKTHMTGNNTYMINVGSVGEPRNNEKIAQYTIYDVKENTIMHQRVDFDFKKSYAESVSKKSRIPESILFKNYIKIRGLISRIANKISTNSYCNSTIGSIYQRNKFHTLKKNIK
jgi:predicted phosphodiesterase